MNASADLRERYDVAVVGAGPAGLAAAGLCARAGLATVLLDEQAAPGGQVYRSVTASPLGTNTVLGPDYWRGAALVREALASDLHYVQGANVWGLLREGEIAVSLAGRSRLLQARRIILATGAMERPFPIPGWTLPGVMSAGGAQILLKSSGLIPQGRTVLAGCGPLLWLLAWQYLNAGVRLDAVLDTAPRTNWRSALRYAASFALSPYLIKGLRLILAVRRNAQVIGNVAELEAQGSESVEAVVYRTSRGEERRLPVDMLILHQGVVPNANLALSPACPTAGAMRSSVSFRCWMRSDRATCRACPLPAMAPALQERKQRRREAVSLLLRPYGRSSRSLCLRPRKRRHAQACAGSSAGAHFSMFSSGRRRGSGCRAGDSWSAAARK